MAGDAKTNSTANNVAGDEKELAAPPAQYQFAQKPEELPGWEGFKQFLWNSEKKEFLGRTGCSWFKIGLFYFIYYTLLTGYFIALLLVFFTTLDDNSPRWKHKDGLIGENPGMGFRPMPDSKKVDSTLIYFYHGDNHENWKPWSDRLDESLKDYNSLMNDSAKPVKDRVDCGWGQSPSTPQVCKPVIDKLFQDDCTKENHYGYKKGTPCVLLKLNKIYEWDPKPYLNRTLPDEAPEDLKQFVKDASRNTDDMVGHMIYVSCEGENAADKENIGKINYYPYPGFPTQFYPYKNDAGYLAPVVFANFKNPRIGTLISISCKAWAHNIHHNYVERMGTVHFELMID